mmetsp:Transcript_67490/g.161963  ORF Transcript_67490/g.161963 Transcript_67490/m.161963 type:complete len:282 (+) Transcript_67490:87-932(+)
MSWYVNLEGRKVWVDSNDIAYTVVEVEEVLPVQELAQLATNTAKAVYQEHIIEDDDGSKGKKKAEKRSGKQRGFVVRVDQDERTIVTSVFQAAADHLVESGIVSRVELDSAGNSRRKKKDKDVEEKPQLPKLLLELGVNECRVQTLARVKHFAHGRGFHIAVESPDGVQKLYLFTSKEITSSQWHQVLTKAIQSGGGQVMEGRMAISSAEDAAAPGSKAPVDKTVKEEDAWLKSVFSMAESDPPAPKKAPSVGEEGDEGEAPAAKAQPKAATNLPPWLRRK